MIVNRKSPLLKITINTDDDSHIGVWFANNNTAVKQSMNLLKDLVSINYQGFVMKVEECKQYIPDDSYVEILFDRKLRYISLDDCILKIEDGKIIKNRSIFSRIVNECIRNSAYLMFINNFASNSDNHFTKLILKDILKAIDELDKDIPTGKI